MIADDNPFYLQEICELVDWEEFDMQVIGSYTSGTSLYNAAKKNIPDVILTDIYMPGMDGLELAAALKALSENIKIVLISSYSEFEYAQKALQMKLNGYLIKPVKKEALISLMKTIQEDILGEKMRQFQREFDLKEIYNLREAALEGYLRELLYHSVSENVIQKQLEKLQFSLPTSGKIKVTCIRRKKNGGETSNIDVEIEKIRFLLKNNSTDMCRFIFLDSNQVQFVMLIAYSERECLIEEILAQLSLDIELQIGFENTISMSESSELFSELPTLYRQIEMMGACKNVMQYIVEEYEDAYEANEQSKFNEISEDNNYIEKMVKFINEHYMESITANEVAEAVYLSFGYANERFMRVYECTIFDFITQCRIEEAKRLLSKTKTKIDVIAELVGHKGKTSFYLSFKKNVGMTPGEYREKYREKS